MAALDMKHETSLASPVAAGSGRIAVVRAYFDVSAALVGVITTALIVGALRPITFGSSAALPHPWLSIAGGGLCAWGARQTSRMLRDRQRSGALAAGLTFTASLVAVGSHAPSWPAAALSLVGLGLVASVWSHLE